jgi:hypothetical protein
VLTYLSRYTHRVAISNRRLVAMDERGVSLRWKDYRAGKSGKTDTGRTRHKTMTLWPEEFMRRFLLHVLPGGFHRIRHYGLLANGARKVDLARARQALCVTTQQDPAARNAEPVDSGAQIRAPVFVCRHCGKPMLVVHCLMRGQAIRAPPPP